jgi:glycolate oxidase
VGSEGTLGVVTAVDVRLLALPEAVRVCVAAFGDVDAASEAVSAIIGAGIVPTALELMDRTITRAVEAHYHAGFPVDAGAVLLIEIAGAADDANANEAAIRRIANAHGALTWRAAPLRACQSASRSAASHRTTTSKMRACRARSYPR